MKYYVSPVESENPEIKFGYLLEEHVTKNPALKVNAVEVDYLPHPETDDTNVAVIDFNESTQKFYWKYIPKPQGD